MHRPFISLLLVVLTGVLLCAAIPAAQARNPTPSPAPPGKGSKNMVTGMIDRLGETEIVINDRLFGLAPASGVHPSTFRRGQVVEGQLDEKRRIRSLRLIRQNHSSNRSDSPAAPEGANGSGKPQPIRREGGVWKN